jgi:hypothetical protein
VSKWIAGAIHRVIHRKQGLVCSIYFVNKIIDEWQAASFIGHHENSSGCSYIDDFVPGDNCARHGPMGRAFHD